MEKNVTFLYHKYMIKILIMPAIPIPNNGISNNYFDICNIFASKISLLSLFAIGGISYFIYQLKNIN